MTQDLKTFSGIVSVLVLSLFFCFSVASGNSLHTSQGLLDKESQLLRSLNEEERLWYQRFLEGVLLFDGWHAITDELLSVFDEDEAADRQLMLQRLGMKIGTEWAKDNDRRKIDTEMLEEWGDRLREARSQGADTTLAMLRAIEREVDMILQKKESLAATIR
jgi:hypothetical protein